MPPPPASSDGARSEGVRVILTGGTIESPKGIYTEVGQHIQHTVLQRGFRVHVSLGNKKESLQTSIVRPDPDSPTTFSVRSVYRIPYRNQSCLFIAAVLENTVDGNESLVNRRLGCAIIQLTQAIQAKHLKLPLLLNNRVFGVVGATVALEQEAIQKAEVRRISNRILESRTLLDDTYDCVYEAADPPRFQQTVYATQVPPSRIDSDCVPAFINLGSGTTSGSPQSIKSGQLSESTAASQTNDSATAEFSLLSLIHRITDLPRSAQSVRVSIDGQPAVTYDVSRNTGSVRIRELHTLLGPLTFRYLRLVVLVETPTRKIISQGWVDLNLVIASGYIDEGHFELTDIKDENTLVCRAHVKLQLIKTEWISDPENSLISIDAIPKNISLAGSPLQILRRINKTPSIEVPPDTPYIKTCCTRGSGLVEGANASLERLETFLNKSSSVEFLKGRVEVLAIRGMSDVYGLGGCMVLAFKFGVGDQFEGSQTASFQEICKKVDDPDPDFAAGDIQLDIALPYGESVWCTVHEVSISSRPILLGKWIYTPDLEPVVTKEVEVVGERIVPADMNCEWSPKRLFTAPVPLLYLRWSTDLSRRSSSVPKLHLRDFDDSATCSSSVAFARTDSPPQLEDDSSTTLWETIALHIGQVRILSRQASWPRKTKLVVTLRIGSMELECDPIEYRLNKLGFLNFVSKLPVLTNVFEVCFYSLTPLGERHKMGETRIDFQGKPEANIDVEFSEGDLTFSVGLAWILSNEYRRSGEGRRVN